MSDVRIPACALRGITPIMNPRGHTVIVDLQMTPRQRLMAVAELLSNGMSEQEAYEGLRGLFPQWFKVEA